MAHQTSSSRCFFFLFKNHAVFRIRDLVLGLDPSFNLDADPYPYLPLFNLFRENNFYSSAEASAEIGSVKV